MNDQPRTADLLSSALEYLAARAARDHKYAEWLITQYLLSREADFATVEQLVEAWHHQHGRSSSEPDPREIALLAEPQPAYGSHGGGGGYHDTIRHDASPMRAAASEHLGH